MYIYIYIYIHICIYTAGRRCRAWHGCGTAMAFPPLDHPPLYSLAYGRVWGEGLVSCLAGRLQRPPVGVSKSGLPPPLPPLTIKANDTMPPV